ncbi:cytochrome P450 [Crepidotus variabilis]|uniref:Cytochrome P450 n=1 Tax=Crepidotus variabilis TaxID=179855 RepID=A0A9P6EHJ4_9AGAR|nr:cytochrome P450 [Crepidotus variabilis]
MASMTVLGALLSISLIYVLKKYVAFRRAVNSVGNHPGFRLLFTAGTLPSLLLPESKYLNQRFNFGFTDKYDSFAERGCDIISKVMCVPETRTYVVLADPAAIKEVVSARARFIKPVKNYRVLAFWGQNIVVSEGELWKKFRKTSAPAFSEKNNKLVWNETVDIVHSLIDQVWGDQDVISLDHCLDITKPIALFVIAAAGFGKSLTWSEEDLAPLGHKMSFKQSLHVVTTRFFIKLMAPTWLLNSGLTQTLRSTRDGFDELHRYMKELVQERERSEKLERHDLLSILKEASLDDEGGSLTEEELISNIFIFLVAGHESTAHTLCFALGLLALYQDEQEKLFQHIKTVLHDGRAPRYEDMPALTYTMAVFNEALRMFPPVSGIPKIATEDTTLSTVNPTGERVTVPVPKGCFITFQVTALHYNPRYWKDPHMYNPSRFLEDWPRDAFLPFSGGARACIGRKFSETEAVAVLTTLVSKYRITVKEEPQFAGETFEERKTRVLAVSVGLTITTVLTGYAELMTSSESHGRAVSTISNSTLPEFPLYSVLFIYVIRKILAFRQALRSLGHHVGPRILITPGSLPGYLLPKIKYVNQGSSFAFRDKYNTFAEYGCDIVGKVVCVPETRAYVAVADPVAIKEITSARARFPKPVKNYRPLAFWGQNIVVSEGELWKKYRKISAPAFSDRNNKLVWNETVGVIHSLINEVWGDQDVISVDHVLDITTPIALFVIAAAGFGKSMSWAEKDIPSPGHSMTFKQSLNIATKQFAIKIMSPKWLLNFGPTEKLRSTRDGYEELHRYMREMIQQRQHSEKVERDDLLSSLLEANADDGSLSEEEVISNIYVFLLAGHETTAHTLGFALGLLALYEAEQEKLYRHINTVLRDGRTPTYEDMSALNYSLAVMYETLRMFPPVGLVPKIAAEDTTLTTLNSMDERVTVPIPKGCNITLQVPALHYNPRYWKNPHSFNPGRFLENWPRDAFLPFSGGPRACIGRKFSETETVAVLTILVSKYRISVKEEAQFAAETFEEKKERVLAATSGSKLTLTAYTRSPGVQAPKLTI